MSEAFGLDGEILLIYYQYTELQARVFHIVEKLMSESPIAGRVEPLLFLLVTKGPGFETQVSRLMSNQSQTRIDNYLSRPASSVMRIAIPVSSVVTTKTSCAIQSRRP